MAKRATVDGASSGSVEATFRIWVGKSGRIHIASMSAGIASSVSDVRKSKRFHPNLYRKLRKFLKREGRWPEDL